MKFWVEQAVRTVWASRPRSTCTAPFDRKNYFTPIYRQGIRIRTAVPPHCGEEKQVLVEDGAGRQGEIYGRAWCVVETQSTWNRNGGQIDSRYGPEHVLCDLNRTGVA